LLHQLSKAGQRVLPHMRLSSFTPCKNTRLSFLAF
jgi:hypothetical protein